MSEHSRCISIAINGREQLSYDRCPDDEMKRSVLEMIFESAVGVCAKDMPLEVLAEERVQVTDFNGNKMPASLQQLWTAIQSFFDTDRTKDPWCIDGTGRMNIGKPSSKRSRTVDCSQPKPRKAADRAVKVCQLPQQLLGLCMRACHGPVPPGSGGLGHCC